MRPGCRVALDGGAPVLQGAPSVLVTPNKIVKDFDKYQGDNSITKAILDRLIQCSARLALEGKNFRLNGAVSHIEIASVV